MSVDISTAMTTASALSGLVLATPQKNRGFEVQDQAGNLMGETILFDIEGEQSVALESDITDHYAEDNSSIQDHIVLKPEVISVRGYKGELTDIVPDTETGAIRAIKDKLIGISGYTPELTVAALLAYNTAFQLYQTGKSVERSVASWKTINKVTLNEINADGLVNEIEVLTQTKQAVAFQQFYGYWKSRTLFTVQTPWAIFKNMAIRSLKVVQNEDTNMMTDFEVSFKMIRFASVNFDEGEFDPTGASDVTKSQGVPQVDRGVSTLTKTSDSLSTYFTKLGA